MDLSFYQDPGNYPKVVSSQTTTYRPPGSGASPWLNLSNQLEDNKAQQLKAQAAGQQGVANTSAWNQLASSGGASGGARERMAYGGAQQGAQAMNQIGADTARNKLGLGVQDQEWNQQAQQKDADRKMQDAQMRNQFNLQKYQLGGQASAAQVLAQAQAASGGGGGSSFICTELRRQGLMTKQETKDMTKFMLKCLPSCAHFFFWYLKNGPKIVRLANEKGIDWAARKASFVDEILYVQNNYGLAAAQDLYGHETHKLAREVGIKVPQKAWSRDWLKSLPMVPFVLLNKTVRKWFGLNWGRV